MTGFLGWVLLPGLVWADSAVVEGVVGTSGIKFINYNWALNLRANFPELR
ncbi:hypothetical protein [Marinobacter gelidimuriae]|nr:hypothetical protein [Marinobacter gelidimuriae]